MEVVLLAGAQSDLLELYTRHGEVGYHVIDEELELLRNMPEIAPTFVGQFRRRVVVGTSSGIFYSYTGSRVIISAILDLRQDPATILRRLGLKR